jgi:DNA-binding IclR family transcriptional regulator
MRSAHPKNEPPAPVVGSADGTQAIRRAAAILKTIAKANSSGLSLADVSESETLPRSTAHRILKCLVDEGFVEHNTESRRYQIGGLSYELGLAVSSGALEVATWRDAVDSVARRTGVTAYLMRRSGLEAACLLKAEGMSVVRVIPVEVGQRRLLGVGAGATALLAALEPDTCERFIDAIAPSLRHHPRITPTVLRDGVAAARASGFAISREKVELGVFGMGMAIPARDPTAVPSLALSIAAHVSLVTDEKVAAWKRILKEEIRAAA